MRDRGGYGGIVRDIWGDAGIVGGAYAAECAERVGGVVNRVEKDEEKDNAETLSTQRLADLKAGHYESIKAWIAGTAGFL
jgi:hypothetical protein